MKRSFLPLLLSAGLVLIGWRPVHAALPAHVTLDAGQRRVLDIQLDAPEAVTSFPGVQAPARVSVPPTAEFMVTALQDGVVKRVLAAPGEQVEAGQVLAWLDSPAVVDLQREYLSALYAESLAKRARERDTELLDAGVIARRRFEETDAAWRQAQARRQAAEQTLHQAGFDAGDLADLKRTGTLRRETPLRAPAAATVLEQYAVPGNRVAINDPVYRLANLQRIWLDIQLPAEAAGNLRVGQPVAAAGRQARVIQIGGAVSADTQTVLVRAEFPAGTDGLRPGTYVHATILEPVEGCYSVPAAAVVSAGQKTVLFVAGTDGFDVVPVRVLGRDGERSYVHGDLPATARVAVSGVAAIKAAWLGMGGE